jgi:hypothetical protein
MRNIQFLRTSMLAISLTALVGVAIAQSDHANTSRVVIGESTQDQDPNGDQGAAYTLDNKDLDFLEPSIKERLLRSIQYQYELQEQPSYILASVGGSSQVLPNPERWLQQHSLILQLSEWFPRTTNMPALVQGAYNDLPPSVQKAKSPIVLGKELCRSSNNSPLQCLAGGGNFAQRLFSGASVTFSVSQRDEVQQGVVVTNLTPSQAWAWGGEVDFNPASLFISASNWKAAETTLSKGHFALLGSAKAIKKLADLERECFDEGPWKVNPGISGDTDIRKAILKLRNDCINEFANPRLVPSLKQGNGTRLAAALIPTFQLKVLSQFDYLKQGGILVQNPQLQRSLKNLTFTWDLRRIVPATSDRVGVETYGDLTHKANASASTSAQNTPTDLTSTKVCVMVSGTTRSYINVGADSTINLCRRLAIALPSVDHYSAACASTKAVMIGNPATVSESAGESNLPDSNCGWQIQNELAKTESLP